MPRVAELDPLAEAELTEALSWTRDGHRRLHEASRLLGEAITSGQVLMAESARAELVAAVNAAARALASL